MNGNFEVPHVKFNHNDQLHRDALQARTEFSTDLDQARFALHEADDMLAITLAASEASDEPLSSGTWTMLKEIQKRIKKALDQLDGYDSRQRDLFLAYAETQRGGAK